MTIIRRFVALLVNVHAVNICKVIKMASKAPRPRRVSYKTKVKRARRPAYNALMNTKERNNAQSIAWQEYMQACMKVSDLTKELENWREIKKERKMELDSLNKLQNDAEMKERIVNRRYQDVAMYYPPVRSTAGMRAHSTSGRRPERIFLGK